MTLDLETYSDSRSVKRTSPTLWNRVGRAILAAIAAQQARRMLAKVVKPYRSRGSPNIPPHLLEDIGLPRDFGDSPRYWDHQ